MCMWQDIFKLPCTLYSHKKQASRQSSQSRRHPSDANEQHAFNDGNPRVALKRVLKTHINPRLSIGVRNKHIPSLLINKATDLQRIINLQYIPRLTKEIVIRVRITQPVIKDPSLKDSGQRYKSSDYRLNHVSFHFLVTQ